MKLQLKRLSLALVNAALISVAGCGGGSDTVATTATTPDTPVTPVTPAVPPAPTTTNVTTTVIDGPIKNATVCMDKNSNGQCDADEVQGKTDAAGSVTLAVPNADVGKFPLLALVGTDAVDADNGPVTVAYSMSAPADKTAIISPLTTLVQQTVASAGFTSAEAAKAVQDVTGIATPLFDDFTTAAAKAAASASASPDAAVVSRIIVVTTQQQAAALAGKRGTPAIDGSTISQADLDRAMQKKMLEQLPEVVTASIGAAVRAATTPAAKEAAILVAASALAASSDLNAASVATLVAVNNQAVVPLTTPFTPAAPAADYSLASLTFTNAANWFVRSFGASLAQATPDASGATKFVDKRIRSNTNAVANWTYGADPARQADLHWNGSAWVGCALNFENLNAPRDVQGKSPSNYCDGLSISKNSRATFDISGKTMASVYSDIRAAGNTNLTVANTSALGAATFPADSKLFYQTTTPLSEAIAYYPGSSITAGQSSVVSQFVPAIAAGGVASTQPAGEGCNTVSVDPNGFSATTLEGLIAVKKGTPCSLGAPTSFTYQGQTYTAPTNDIWSYSTVNIALVGTAPVNSGTAPGFYTGNIRYRFAFKGAGANAITYYACQQRFSDGATRACAEIGTGAYAIATLGDARVMTFTNLPAQLTALTFNTVLVERNGLVYSGYQNKLNVSSTARLNATAGNALLTQLGLSPIDPSVPVALTAASYQGVWDVRDSAATSGATVLFVNANGTSSCQDYKTLVNSACTVTVTNPATGAFTVTSATGSASGNFNFLTGTVTGTYNFTSPTVSSGTLVGQRR
jgi:trimeric autotransporter adhesin